MNHSFPYFLGPTPNFLKPYGVCSLVQLFVYRGEDRDEQHWTGFLTKGIKLL